MSEYPNRTAYVKSAWQFQVRDNPVGDPGPGCLLLEVHACGICGTDLHIADRTAADWQTFGHEAAGVVKAVGAGVTRFAPDDRVALDSSAPCGKCASCLPVPYGRGRPDLCPNPATYWAGQTMGFSRLLIAPQECAVHVPDHLPLDHACLVEPLGVCLDLAQTADVRPGDHVLVVGPGPLGLGAVYVARQMGAERIWLAGRSGSKARLEAGLALGADAVIEVDRRPLAQHDFGGRKPDKVLVTAPPDALPEAVAVAALGGSIAYIGIAWDARTTIQLDADAFHFSKLSLRASHAWPGTHARHSLRLLATDPALGPALVSHRFGLEEIERAMLAARDDRAHVKKAVVVMA